MLAVEWGLQITIVEGSRELGKVPRTRIRNLNRGRIVLLYRE
jgi:hypothetical protein